MRLLRDQPPSRYKGVDLSETALELAARVAREHGVENLPRIRHAAELAGLVKTIPAGRIGSVDDAVNAVLYLLSDEAAYVTGTSLHVSGGWGM